MRSKQEFTITVLALVLCYTLYHSISNYVLYSKTYTLVQGEPAPDFELDEVGGGKVRLSDLRGQPVLLFFFSPTCPSCLEQFPAWYKVKEMYDVSEFSFYGVCHAELADIGEFYLNTNSRFPVLTEAEEVLQEFNVRRFPTVVLVDQAGKIVFMNDELPLDEQIKQVKTQIEKAI